MSKLLRIAVILFLVDNVFYCYSQTNLILTIYNKAIELWPQYDDAQHNRKIILDNFPELKR